MKLKDIGDAANVIAAVGVIFSLLFVGYEIRQNTAETRALSAATVGDNFRDLLLVRAQTPSLDAIVHDIYLGEELSSYERSQFAAYLMAIVRTVEDAYLQFQAGRLEEEQLQVRFAGLNSFLRTPVGLTIYQRNRALGLFSDDFTRWVDQQTGE